MFAVAGGMCVLLEIYRYVEFLLVNIAGWQLNELLCSLDGGETT